jgi:DNA gyrase/topoisomerase IV subunit B
MTVQALDSIEIVRKRPGMFIGDVSTPNHLAEEVLDNALDEIANGYATELKIFYDIEQNSFWCTDNGRGIPVHQMTLPDGEIEDSMIVLCTRLFSGTKFDTEDYNQLIGMHGVGLVAVNALSEWMIVKTRDRQDKSKVHTYNFLDSKFYSKEEENNNDFSWSTTVGFKPNKEFFNSIEFNSRYFVERLILVQSVFDLDKFSFNGKEIPHISFVDYVKDHLRLEDSDMVYTLEHKTSDEEKINVILTYVESDDNIIIGNVNLRFCDGKYLTSFQTELKKSIGEKLDKRFAKVTDREYLNGLRLFVLLNIPEPKFDSQTKTRMVLDVKNILIDPLKSQIDWFVTQKGIIETIQTNLENKLHQKITKSSKSVRSTKRVAVDKLRDCKKIPGDVLYILEGDSAEGTLKDIRFEETEALFPLRGKVLNVESTTLEKIKNNKEIRDLLEALGSGNNRRYKSIKILSDADKDGQHIAVLLLLILQKYAPDMIKEGKVSVIIPPLFGATKGGKYTPIYNESRVEDFKQKGFKVTRFKGLGEMDPEELEVCIRSGFEYNVKWPENDTILNSLISIITNTDVKRAIMDNPSIKMDVILNEVINNIKLKTN